MGIPGLEYGPKVDAWSAGVVLFVLLGGYPPFWAESEPVLFGLVKRGHFTFDDPAWAGVSERCVFLFWSGVEVAARPFGISLGSFGSARSLAPLRFAPEAKTQTKKQRQGPDPAAPGGRPGEAAVGVRGASSPVDPRGRGRVRVAGGRRRGAGGRGDDGRRRLKCHAKKEKKERVFVVVVS